MTAAEIRAIRETPTSEASYASREAWLEAGTTLANAHSGTAWRFADWLVAGEDKWGRSAMVEAAELTGASAGKISDYAKTSRGYPVSDRLKSLSFSHHLEAVRLPATEREEVLAAGGWDVRTTRETVRERSSACVPRTRDYAQRFARGACRTLRLSPLRRRRSVQSTIIAGH